MIVTDAAFASVSQPSSGPLRAFLAFLGLAQPELNDRHAPPQAGQPISPPDWQQARAAAHRGVAAAGRGEFDAADAYFTTAFTLDRALRPNQIAHFWTMSLSGLQTAERALRSAGRYDEAATLASEVSFRFATHPTRQPLQVAS